MGTDHLRGQFNDGQVRAAYYCAAEVIRSRRLKSQPIPSWLSSHYLALEAALKVSRLGRENNCEREESETEMWISAREAGAILSRSKRQVHRIAESLGGEMVDGRWMFRRSEVLAYTEARDEISTASAGRDGRSAVASRRPGMGRASGESAATEVA